MIKGTLEIYSNNSFNCAVLELSFLPLYKKELQNNP